MGSVFRAPKIEVPAPPPVPELGGEDPIRAIERLRRNPQGKASTILTSGISSNLGQSNKQFLAAG